MPKCIVITTNANSLLIFRKELLIALSQQYKVIALAPDATADIISQLADINVELLAIPLERTGTNPLKDIKTIIAISKLCKRLTPQIVFCYTPKAVIYGSIGAKLAGINNIVAMLTGLGYAFTMHNWRTKIIKLIQKILYKIALANCRQIIFQNRDDLQDFVNYRLVNQRKCRLVNGSGVNLAKFNVTDLPPAISFLMIARLIKEKGIYEYIQAARQVKQLHPKVIFYLVGDIDTKSSAITQVELTTWQRAGIIEYLGYLNDVRPAIANCSVLILPSYREGTPHVVLQAMAMGRPIITTNVPGCKETVITSNNDSALCAANGILVAPHDVNGLVAAMLQIIAKPQLLTNMGKRSRELAEAKYDINKVNAAMLEILAPI